MKHNTMEPYKGQTGNFYYGISVPKYTGLERGKVFSANQSLKSGFSIGYALMKGMIVVPYWQGVYLDEHDLGIDRPVF